MINFLAEMGDVPLIASDDAFWNGIDKKATVSNVNKFAQQIKLLKSMSKGVFYEVKQPISVFYARQLLLEIRRTIQDIGLYNEELGSVLDFSLLQKHAFGNTTDMSFITSHNLSERHFYRLRTEAFLQFAYQFNAGSLLVFKEEDNG